MKGHRIQKLIFVLFFAFLASNVFGQWQQLNGPEGGYIRGIISDGSNIYAASGGGVLVSDNDGSSWEFRNEGLKSCDTKSFTKLGNYVFVSTDENVFRTSNAGQT